MHGRVHLEDSWRFLLKAWLGNNRWPSTLYNVGVPYSSNTCVCVPHLGMRTEPPVEQPLCLQKMYSYPVKCKILSFAWSLTLALAAIAQDTCVGPFETDQQFTPRGTIDTLNQALWERRGIVPARVCSDVVFVRRVYIDLIGTLPDPVEVRAFLESDDPDKRRQLVDMLMLREEFADYWALKWCDLLRVKAEFPINLWPNAVQAYHRWVRDCIRHNKPYDLFVRELLTSSGSNFRVAPVNFYRAIQGHDPVNIASAVALTFMGSRLETWAPERREGMAAFFSRLAFKGTAEWKEEIVLCDPTASAPLTAVFPDGTSVTVPAFSDPRPVFAAWLISEENEWFGRSIVNRIWFWLMGRGIIHEPDDIRPDNPPANAELLAYLEKELAKAHYDLRHVFRLILNSSTYQQSAIPQSEDPDAANLCAFYKVRLLDAEVLIDALCWISGTDETYVSMIPEPFTFVPEHKRTISLADGSVTSQFLEMFGRPPRDTGFESERSSLITKAQRLHLLNSTHVQKKIERSRRLRSIIKAYKSDPGQIVRLIYLNLLSRYPTDDELVTALEYVEGSGLRVEQAATDVAWALVNSKEFLYRH